jgi:hypothetical protein
LSITFSAWRWWRLLEYCSDSLAVRLYLGYDIDEILPWHSTISRTRQLYGEDVFLNLFQQVLQLCVSKGMVRGKRQSVDSAYVKANASMDSLQEKEVLDDAIHYATELNDNSEFKVKASMKKAVEKHHAWKVKEYKGMPGHVDQPKQIDEHGNLIRPKFTSNHTHYSTTDSDARISVKPGKARQLNYSAQLSVDDKHHVITGALADFASKKDSDSLEQIVAQAKENLEQNNITLEEVIADAAYSSGKALKYLAQANIKGWIPNFGQYKSERYGFVYNEDKNQYECQRGNHAILSYKGIKTDSKGYQKHQYRSSESDCSKCTLRAKCCGVVTKYKKIEDSIDKPYYDTDVGCSWFFRRFVTQKCVNVEVEFNRIFFHFLKNFLISISFFQTVNIYYRFRVVKNRIFVSEIAFVFILSFVSILMQTQLLQHVAEI